MSLSLMSCQMIRVISSPSISTTGLSTLIFAMWMQTRLERGYSRLELAVNGRALG